MKRLASTLYDEEKKRKVQLTVAKDPARHAFIDRLTRPFFEGDTPPLQFSHGACKEVFDKNEPKYRTDTVILKLRCGRSECSLAYHEFRFTCYPERLKRHMPKVPDAAMLFAPYTTSVQFWSRVQECQIDDTHLFSAVSANATEVAEIFNNKFIIACLPSILRVVDLIFTFVIDHVFTVQNPHSRESVLPNWFHYLAFSCPHALVAHGHRMGNSITNPLEVYPGDIARDQFWETYEAACARVQLPPTLAGARYLVAKQSHGFHMPRHSEFYPFARRFPNAEFVTAGIAALPFVAALASAFSNVRNFGATIRSTDGYQQSDKYRWITDLVLSVLANRRLEQCAISSTPQFRHDDPVFDARRPNSVPRIFSDIGTFVELRRGLLELATADYHAKPLPAIEKQPKAWTAFFNNPLFERQTLGIVAAFLYDANFAEITRDRIDHHMRLTYTIQ